MIWVIAWPRVAPVPDRAARRDKVPVGNFYVNVR